MVDVAGLEPVAAAVCESESGGSLAWVDLDEVPNLQDYVRTPGQPRRGGSGSIHATTIVGNIHIK